MSSDQKDEPKSKFEYFVDGHKYESASETLTGAQIKAQLPSPQSGYDLFLEGHGNDEDRLIRDDESVDLGKQHGGPKRFITVPPATFG